MNERIVTTPEGEEIRLSSKQWPMRLITESYVVRGEILLALRRYLKGRGVQFKFERSRQLYDVMKRAVDSVPSYHPFNSQQFIDTWKDYVPINTVYLNGSLCDDEEKIEGQRRDILKDMLCRTTDSLIRLMGFKEGSTFVLWLGTPAGKPDKVLSLYDSRGEHLRGEVRQFPTRVTVFLPYALPLTFRNNSQE